MAVAVPTEQRLFRRRRTRARYFGVAAAVLGYMKRMVRAPACRPVR